jgi:hypothetical protein
MSRDASQHPDAHGFLNYSGAMQAGDDLKVENNTTVPPDLPPAPPLLEL